MASTPSSTTDDPGGTGATSVVPGGLDVDGSGQGGNGPTALASTGANSVGLVAAGLAMVVFGAALLVQRRRLVR